MIAALPACGQAMEIELDRNLYAAMHFLKNDLSTKTSSGRAAHQLMTTIDEDDVVDETEEHLLELMLAGEPFDALFISSEGERFSFTVNVSLHPYAITRFASAIGVEVDDPTD